MEEIPPELEINWDHTGINYIPVSNWTMEKEGAKHVEIFGVQDKRQMTVVFAGTMTGHFLPPQLIYAGKTKKCLPTVSFPKSWDVIYTQNDWANEETTESYIHSILVPYIETVRKSQATPSAALVVFDCFKGPLVYYLCCQATIFMWL